MNENELFKLLVFKLQEKTNNIGRNVARILNSRDLISNKKTHFELLSV